MPVLEGAIKKMSRVTGRIEKFMTWAPNYFVIITVTVFNRIILHSVKAETLCT